MTDAVPRRPDVPVLTPPTSYWERREERILLWLEQQVQRIRRHEALLEERVGDWMPPEARP